MICRKQSHFPLAPPIWAAMCPIWFLYDSRCNAISGLVWKRTLSGMLAIARRDGSSANSLGRYSR
jgi:hypothetical protein